MTAPHHATRYYALDNLRGAMMLLGIYWHVAIGYSATGPWPYKQLELTTALDTTIALLHVFRMPVFFVMAGFFAALLYERYGFWRAAKNRMVRIVVPLVVGWIVVFPPVHFLTAVGNLGLEATLERMRSGMVIWWLHPLHFWFLEYLIVLYGLAILIVGAIRLIVPLRICAFFNRLFRWTVECGWAPVFIAPLALVALLRMPTPELESPPHFMPLARIVLIYAIPFAFGWMLHINADLLETLRRRAWTYMLISLVPAAIVLGFVPLPPDARMSFAAACVAYALLMWLLIFGIIGLFLRFLNAENARLRYLCESSYFLYLAHMPVVLFFQLALAGTPLPPVLKVAIVSLATTVSLLVMYHYGVRPTVIGSVLNGRRYGLRRVAVPAT